MEVRAKIDESDRPNLVAGQPAVVEVDALPGEKFTARIGQLVRPRQPRQLLRVGERDAVVRRDAAVRSTRSDG